MLDTLRSIVMLPFTFLAGPSAEPVSIEILQRASHCPGVEAGVTRIESTDSSTLSISLGFGATAISTPVDPNAGGQHYLVKPGIYPTAGYQIELTSDTADMESAEIVLPITVTPPTGAVGQVLEQPCAIVWIDTLEAVSVSLPDDLPVGPAN